MQKKSLSLSEVLDLIKEKMYNINFRIDIPDELKSNIDVLKSVLEYLRLGINDLPKDVRDNKEVLKMLAKINGYEFESFPSWAKEDEDIALAAIKCTSDAFQYASKTLRGDREFVIKAFQLIDSSGAFEFIVGNEIKNDLEIVKLAVSGHVQNFGKIPASFRSNREVIDIVLNKGVCSYLCFELFPADLLDDRDIAMKAVNDDWNCFAHISSRLRDDEELVGLAVRKRGVNLEYASDRLKDDKEIVKIALLEGDDIPHVLQLMSPRLKKDKELIIGAMEIDSRFISSVDPELHADPDVIKACMKDREYFYGDAYKYFPDSVRKDRSVALKMSAGRDFPLELCPPEFKKDKEIVANAVKSSAANLKYVAPELLKEDAFVVHLYRMNNDILDKLSQDQKSRLFSATIQSPEHNGYKWVIHMNLDRIGYVTDQRRTAQKVEIVKDGSVVFSKNDVTLIKYEEDGPVGSYLSERSINNYVLCGAFVFWVEENSEKETWTSNLSKSGQSVPQGSEPRANDNFLKHKVALVDLATGKHEQIFFGRNKYLPKGFCAFNDSREFDEALTILSQAETPLSERFRKLDSSCLEVINQQPAQVGGAARIFINEWRWLIPNPKGPMAALEVLKKTSDLEDWNWLKTNIGTLSDADKILLQEHFAEASFAEEVRQLCK